MEEFETALSWLKAGGLSEILPEMILCGGPVLHDKLLALMEAVWREGEVFRDWRDAVIIPVPKKGNLQSCDNWWGICCREGDGSNYSGTASGDGWRVAARLAVWLSEGIRLCGHDFCGQAVDGEDKRIWGLTVYDFCWSEESLVFGRLIIRPYQLATCTNILPTDSRAVGLQYIRHDCQWTVIQSPVPSVI